MLNVLVTANKYLPEKKSHLIRQSSTELSFYLIRQKVNIRNSCTVLFNTKIFVILECERIKMHSPRCEISNHSNFQPKDTNQ